MVTANKLMRAKQLRYTIFMVSFRSFATRSAPLRQSGELGISR